MLGREYEMRCKRGSKNEAKFLMLLSEKAALLRMIRETPKSDVIDKLSLECRKQKVETEIANMAPDAKLDIPML